jgi:hypothetical protein
LRKAQELGVIDRAGINPTHEIEDADIVLVATPVAQMADIFDRIAPYLGPNTVVTDGGSTKGDVVRAARAGLGDRIGQFVPAHPIAGAENSGPSAARWDLYQGKKVVVTPLPENNDDALDHIKRAWSLCGADIYELTPEMHDRVLPPSVICRICCPMRWCLIWRCAMMQIYSLPSPPPVSVISPVSQPAILKCGETSALPTVRRCWGSWTVTGRNSTIYVQPWRATMASDWKKSLVLPGRLGVTGPAKADVPSAECIAGRAGVFAAKLFDCG